MANVEITKKPTRFAKKPLAVRIVEEEEKIDAQNAHNKHHSQASNIIFVFGQWVI